ncbi:hypothetical protein ABZ646_33155 [Streptomyces sp. NPDC007162]|uniref:hypothetical protein n=1 Tax=Streptomyces sp. NPDC007162 TaxID=3156917 RepID=UPI0033FCE69E
MTTAYSESPTERVPGRVWTVRLTGHADRTATVTCSTAACRMPPRSKDLAALRAFAAGHAAAHARAATVRPNARCHCGAQQCEAHPDTRTQCAGGVALVLQHDPAVGRVWTLEEICEACARVLPHISVLARAQRPSRTTAGRPAEQQPPPAAPRPGIPGGFSSLAAGPSDDGPRPARRPRRAPRPSRGRPRGEGR